MEIVQQGGNAFDAGVAALLVGGVVEQDLYGIGGEALILVYPHNEGMVTSINGQGWAPAAANVDAWLAAGKNLQAINDICQINGSVTIDVTEFDYCI